MFFGSLRPLVFFLVGGGGALAVGASQNVPLKVGTRYEIRTSGIVYVRAAGGDARAVDLLVRPDTPLYFTAEVNQLTLAAGNGDAIAWIREEQ